MIEKTLKQREIRSIRKWARKHQEEVYNKLGRKCAKCGSVTQLTIHHKQYEKDINCLEILCSKCHREFHKLELKKRILCMLVDKICDSDRTNLKEFKEDLIKEIDDIPVEFIKGIRLDGI